ncbi:nuclear transport factor 2 family protein [Nocardioides carbamazepini]|uniref:nuclear transport factor 2 family protein n=1 Tax=Nocardioides carbamazepini TaxID=2854259 RepID=UPI00214A0F5B|nr:nuclear transport factor 2 family protein [Nocardioides carbamazepini]MCR1786259.1 nuclear transport factor 2 family protein [Nocardioides carbamazepini]
MTTTDLAALAALADRVARLEEAELARNLLHAYAEVLDDPTPEAVAALFTDDGVLSVPAGDFTGHAEVAGFYRDRLAGASEKRHFIMNVRTRPQGPGLVEIASYFVFTAREPDASGLGWGTYLDLVAVSDGVARFRHKTITPHLATDLTAGWPAAP